MAKSKSYWEKRMEQLYTSQDKLNINFDKKMRKEYHRLETNIQKEIASYYSRFGKDDVIQYRQLVQSLSSSERDLLYKDYEEFARRNPQYMQLMPIRESIYQLNRLEGLHLSIRMQMVELGAFEQEGFDKLLKEAYERGYLSSMKGLDNASSFFSVNNIAMQQTLNEKWINSGNFSDRIWTNKEKLLNTLNNEIRDGIIRGDTYQKMARTIAHRMDVGGNESLRLIVTESAFVLNQANKQAFMDALIEKYTITAVMDSKTSPTCRHLDGETFEFKDAKVGVNYPPFHSWCRTTVVPEENE
ncbi:phage head morphogenesis protein [Oceanobacillus arenosus]|uniref:Phage head morphogenesis protein n=1 Tax=Oceanobacillus arenosus TaxID=1229153 RepID=A0A3D8PP54_9BACI|nr:minor capsid protein [Oceanobacillus arenosus]RDW17039.1 phage head morphogenesis protein [Oceanobacillus arenosus]